MKKPVHEKLFTVQFSSESTRKFENSLNDVNKSKAEEEEKARHCDET